VAGQDPFDGAWWWGSSIPSLVSSHAIADAPTCAQVGGDRGDGFARQDPPDRFTS